MKWGEKTRRARTLAAENLRLTIAEIARLAGCGYATARAASMSVPARRRKTRNYSVGGTLLPWPLPAADLITHAEIYAGHLYLYYDE